LPAGNVGLPGRGAARFVGIFVVLVLTQLSAYRYLIESLGNDFYLFNVAQHTTAVLGFIGYQATLEESTGNLNPAEVRAYLGVNPDSSQPLSAWELYRYRALGIRNPSRLPVEFGPRVSFVLKPGIHHRLRELEKERQNLVSEEDAPENTLESLEQDIFSLREELNAGLQDPKLRAQQQGVHFSFNVVPTCGAIEVMAIFLAAVIAFPAGWRARLFGLVCGLLFLYGVNIFRLTCLAFIGALDGGGAWFTFIHEYVWQAIYVVFVVVVWLIWVEYGVRRRQT
jgi:exosortase/archaeosortase family protein